MAEKGESSGTGIPNPFTELVTSFRELKDAPRGFWYTNYIYWLDGVAYFGNHVFYNTPQNSLLKARPAPISPSPIGPGS